MSEDKMRDNGFEQWWRECGQFCRAGGGQYEETFAYEAWKSCAAIKDAEIAELKLEIGDWKLTAAANFNSGEAVIKQQKAEIAGLKTRLSGRTCFIPPEFQKQLDDAHAEIVARKSCHRCNGNGITHTSECPAHSRELNQQLLEEYYQRKEIAARDLTIKDLREALAKAEPFIGYGASVPHINKQVEQALAKSEHHNSRALEKMLLEAELKGLENISGREWTGRRQEVKAKLAELNKE